MATAIPPSESSRLIPVIPIGLVADRAPCLLVGGGIVALRKAAWLLECGATIHVIASQFDPAFDLCDATRITRETTVYSSGMDLRQYALVISATDDAAVNQAVANDAARAGIPCNVVDDPSKCTFIVPATVVRGALRVSVATGGGSPVLARCLREELSEQFPTWYGDFVEALGVVRERLRAAGMSYDDRARLLTQLVAPEERAQYAGLDRKTMEQRLLAHVRF